MRSKLKAVVIGAGGIGHAHARAYVQREDVELTAAADVSEAARLAFADAYDIKVYEDYTEMLEREKPDLISVATPESVHLEMAREIAGRGIPMLMEKPLARSLGEAAQLVREVERSGTLMAVNYILRRDRRFQDLKQRILAGELGDPVTVFARRRGTFAGAEKYGPWTDLLISTAIHDLDLMIWFNGDMPQRVFAESITLKCAAIGTPDAFAATLKFPNGSLGMLDTSWVLPSTLPAPLDASLHFIGTRGGAFIDGSNQGVSLVSETSYHLPDHTHWPFYDGEVGGCFARSVDHFVACVRNGAAPDVDGREALRSLAVVEAVGRSAATGLPVDPTQLLA
ncbi:Gfo/Idh/MocA family protein [Paenibacillaceae bacterium WGS1546]|uniref:Gfo/Idh/MocA family protein n=1 Tax=Cohnella sp. WGS1546 TaxID=3366810 RepID=UPI00372D2528